MNKELELAQALNDFANAATGASTVTTGPATTTTRGVVTSLTPLLVRVGIASTATPIANSAAGYTPTVGDVVVVARTGHRQYITGRTTSP